MWGVDAQEQGVFLRLNPTFAYAKASFLMTFATGGVPHAGSQQSKKQDEELTVAQIMNSLLPNSDLN